MNNDKRDTYLLGVFLFGCYYQTLETLLQNMKIKIAEPMIVFCDTSLSTSTILEKGEYEVSQIEKLADKDFAEFAWYKINTFGYVFAINHEYPNQGVKILP